MQHRNFIDSFQKKQMRDEQGRLRGFWKAFCYSYFISPIFFPGRNTCKNWQKQTCTDDYQDCQYLHMNLLTFSQQGVDKDELEETINEKLDELQEKHQNNKMVIRTREYRVVSLKQLRRLAESYEKDQNIFYQRIEVVSRNSRTTEDIAVQFKQLEEIDENTVLDHIWILEELLNELITKNDLSINSTH